MVTRELIGRQIRAAREERGMSPERLAADLEVALSTVIRWENGAHDPSFRQVARMAQLLGKRIDWFMSDPTVGNGNRRR